MLYRQNFDTFIRIYEDVGYIVNKSNFKDHVTDKSGSVFLKALSRKPKSIDELVKEISSAFINIDMSVLKQDAIDFFQLLEEDGFIVSGNTPQELDNKDKRFSYSQFLPKTIREDFTPEAFRAEKDTQYYLENYFKNKPHLTQFQIELTSRCNENCLHCYIPHDNRTEDIDPMLYYNVLEQCKDMGVLDLTLSGGEPMLHPEFFNFLRKAKEYDFSINILSNLTVLTDEIIMEMKANRLSSVQVSLYSMKPEIHDSITRVSGSFEKTKSAILKLINNEIPLQISCPVMKQNKKCYVEVSNWAEEKKVRAVADYIIMGRYDNTADNLDNRLSVDEVGEIINDIIENDILYRDRLFEADFYEVVKRDLGEDIICGVCISSICMVANGNIYPCAGWQNYICGSLKEQSLREIWDNSPKVKYLRNLKKKDMPKCLNCPYIHFCAICMVRNANESRDGNLFEINEHFCKIAALNRKIVLDWKARMQAG